MATETTPTTLPALPASLAPLLHRTPQDPRPVVLMTCGLAGAGKTTLCRAILAAHPSFHRLSIDFIIHANHGLYGIDYPASAADYAAHMDEADVIYSNEFTRLLAAKQDIIIERSFYAKEDRNEFRTRAHEAGARVVFVYLRAREKEVLWRRICNRALGKRTADSSLDISRDVFEGYWEGFEEPVGEGEIVLDVGDGGGGD